MEPAYTDMSKITIFELDSTTVFISKDYDILTVESDDLSDKFWEGKHSSSEEYTTSITGALKFWKGKHLTIEEYTTAITEALKIWKLKEGTTESEDY